MCGTLFVANDFNALIQQLPAVEQLIVVHDPIPEFVNFPEDSRRQRIVEIKFASWEQSFARHAIPIALEEGA